MITNLRRTAIFLVVLVVVIVTLILTLHWTSSPNSPYTFDQNRTAVIKQMQSLDRMETAQFTIEKIIDAQTSQTGLQQFLFGDKILLIAHGDVIAGVDLSKVKQSDVEVSGRDLIVNLPPPQIFVTTLDDNQTKVFDRQTGLLTKGDPNLETQARSEAEKEIRQAACDSGILSQAGQNAQKQLKALFQQMDFNSVTINISSGSC